MLLRGLGCAVLVALCGATPASADIYWANEATGTIARADDAGTTVDPSFVTGATSPRGVAIDGSYVYWAHDGDAGISGSVGRAPLATGSPANQSLISTAAPPQGVAVDNTRIYWTQPSPTDPSSAGSVGRATLDGLFPTQSFVPTGPAPCGVVSNADDVYWANGGNPGTVGSSHGAFDVRPSFITATSDPCGVAQAEARIYWTNRAANTIGVANQDGSDPISDLVHTGASSAPCGVAVAGNHIYWTSRGTDTIGRADLDGSHRRPSFISGTAVADPCGIAVTPTAAAQPDSFRFQATGVGDGSEIEAFYVANSSSSVLSFSGASLVGPDAASFELTGNGCQGSVAPPGLGCIVNVRFSPSASGEKQAVLRVTSAAGNSPSDVSLSGLAKAPPAPPEGGPPPPATRHDRTLSISRAKKRPRLRGTLASDAAACSTSAEVTLFKSRMRRDRRIGSDLTDEAGSWRVGAKGVEGRLYATTELTQLADGSVCPAVASAGIRVRYAGIRVRYAGIRVR